MLLTFFLLLSITLESNILRILERELKIQQNWPKAKQFPTVTQSKLWPNCWEGSRGLFFAGFFQGQSADLPQDCWSERSCEDLSKGSRKIRLKICLKLFVCERAVATTKWGRATDTQNCLPGSGRIWNQEGALYLLLSSTGKSITCWTSHATIRDLIFLWEVQWEVKIVSQYMGKSTKRTQCGFILYCGNAMHWPFVGSWKAVFADLDVLVDLLHPVHWVVQKFDFYVSSKFCRMPVCSPHTDWNFNMLKTYSSAKKHLWMKNIVQKRGMELQDPTVPPTKPPHPLKDSKDNTLAILTVVPGNMGKSSRDIESPQLLIQNGTALFSRETTSLKMSSLGVHNAGAFNSFLTPPSRLWPKIVKPVLVWSRFTLCICCSCSIVAPCGPMTKPMWFALTKADLAQACKGQKGFRNRMHGGGCHKDKEIIEGSLEVQLPTIWTVEEQSREVKSEEKNTGARKSEERRYSRAKC